MKAKRSVKHYNLFRPTCEPERTIYDAFQLESEKRSSRRLEEWLEAEVQAVWRAARDYAQAHNMRVPTLQEVQHAERSAYGHNDYAQKWALYVSECMREGK